MADKEIEFVLMASLTAQCISIIFLLVYFTIINHTPLYLFMQQVNLFSPVDLQLLGL